MSCILQVSDTHFGTEQDDVVAALERLVEAQRPELLVLSGDITQRATRAQFEQARAFVKRLDVPATLVIPGNHDIPLLALTTRVFAPYRRLRRAFGEDLEPVVDLPGFLAIGVNATRWFRHQDGEVSSAQIERVAARLESAPHDQLKLVVVHQPVAVTRAEDRSNLLHGRERAVMRWAEAGADLILGGHIHLPYVMPLEKEFAGLPGSVWCVQAGTATSSRVRAGAPNSVNLIRRLSAAATSPTRQCVVERWDYAAATQDFRSHEPQVLALSAHPPAAQSARG